MMARARLSEIDPMRLRRQAPGPVAHCHWAMGSCLRGNTGQSGEAAR